MISWVYSLKYGIGGVRKVGDWYWVNFPGMIYGPCVAELMYVRPGVVCQFLLIPNLDLISPHATSDDSDGFSARFERSASTRSRRVYKY